MVLNVNLSIIRWKTKQDITVQSMTKHLAVRNVSATLQLCNVSFYKLTSSVYVLGKTCVLLFAGST